MSCKLVHVGFGNMVVADRVVAIISPASAPIKRLREEARDAGLLIDATQGRKTRAVLVMDSRHVVISAIQPETISARYEGVSAASGGDDSDEEAESPAALDS